MGLPTTSLTPGDTWVRYRVERMTIKTISPGLTIDTAFLLGSNRYKVDGNIVSLVTGTPHPSYSPTPFIPKQYYYLLVDHSKYSPTAITPESFVYLGTQLVEPVASTSCWNSITPSIALTTNVVN